MTSKKDDRCRDNFIEHQKYGDYGGAADLIQVEKEYLENRTDNNEKNLVGLALSGGGIRSAVFSLGVMQRLARNGWMEKIDYLSTVSGGGYIGSSLTWYLHQSSKNDGDTKFGLTADNFPFGTHRLGKINPNTNEPEKGGDQDKSAILQALRQNGKYLTPGNGITIFSLLGVFLRGTFLSIAVYFPLLVLFFLLMYESYIIRPSADYTGLAAFFSTIKFPGLGVDLRLNFALTSVVFLICAATFASIIHAIKTYLPSKDYKKLYMSRRSFERRAGWVIVSIVVLTAIGFLPIIHEYLICFSCESTAGRDKAALIGTISMILGFIASIATFLKSGSIKKRSDKIKQSTGEKYSLKLLTGLTIFLMIYGILFLSYSFVYELKNSPEPILWAFFIAWILVALVVGRYVNLNYVSVHRYYRDRLMETFMPNVDEVLKNGHRDTSGATDVDRFKLSDICREEPLPPYHIINTNIVLVESPNKKYRGRGGDNFILSPFYCGSNATGWLQTKKFMNDEMTLPTAMAISGAAANPDAGVGGEGPTRNRALSLLMSLLNIRLGYWAPHPNPKINTWHCSEVNGIKINNLNPLRGYRPNFFHPMLTSTAFGKLISKFNRKKKDKQKGTHFGKTEHSRLIELTDGGHFENLGLYELIRRKLKTIIVCDGSADPGFDFEDLANAIEKIRVDFGVVLKLDINPLIPGRKSDPATGLRSAERGYITGEIDYPDNTKGRLIYIKTSFTKGMYPDLVYYKKQNPLFPDQPTTDQFFDEKQFEAYRGLGNYIAKQLTLAYRLTDGGEIEDVKEETGDKKHD